MVRPLIVAGVWVTAVLATALALMWHGWWVLPAAVLLALAALGTWDLVQTRHTILRLYPIIGSRASCSRNRRNPGDPTGSRHPPKSSGDP